MLELLVRVRGKTTVGILARQRKSTRVELLVRVRGKPQ
jgi:hypothetical protein